MGDIYYDSELFKPEAELAHVLLGDGLSKYMVQLPKWAVMEIPAGHVVRITIEDLGPPAPKTAGEAVYRVIIADGLWTAITPERRSKWEAAADAAQKFHMRKFREQLAAPQGHSDNGEL